MFPRKDTNYALTIEGRRCRRRARRFGLQEPVVEASWDFRRVDWVDENGKEWKDRICSPATTDLTGDVTHWMPVRGAGRCLPRGSRRTRCSEDRLGSVESQGMVSIRIRHQIPRRLPYYSRVSYGGDLRFFSDCGCLNQEALCIRVEYEGDDGDD